MATNFFGASCKNDAEKAKASSRTGSHADRAVLIQPSDVEPTVPDDAPDQILAELIGEPTGGE